MRCRMVSSRLTAGGFGGYFSAGTTYSATNIAAGHQYSDKHVAPTRCRRGRRPREHHREQRAHRDAERQHAESHADVGLHAAGEQLGAVLVAAVHGLVGRADAVLEVDRPADDGLDEDAREDEREHSGEGAGQKAAPDDVFFHCVGCSRGQWQGKPSRWRASCTNSCT